MTVKTNHGSYSAEKVIISAGAWIARFLPPEYATSVQSLSPGHVLVRNHAKTAARALTAPGFPIFIWIFGEGSEFGFYGFPTLDEKTIKVATEQFAASTDPDHVQRNVGIEEERTMFNQ